jgi:succinyl-CoA synthetase alpha subunit
VRLQVDAEALVGMTHVYSFSDGIPEQDLMVVALRVNENKSVKVGGSSSVAACV